MFNNEIKYVTSVRKIVYKIFKVIICIYIRNISRKKVEKYSKKIYLYLLNKYLQIIINKTCSCIASFHMYLQGIFLCIRTFHIIIFFLFSLYFYLVLYFLRSLSSILCLFFTGTYVLLPRILLFYV